MDKQSNRLVQTKVKDILLGSINKKWTWAGHIQLRTETNRWITRLTEWQPINYRTKAERLNFKPCGSKIEFTAMSY